MTDLHDEIHLESGAKDQPAVLVYMIAGNPGLVEYYRDFLKNIFDSLRDRRTALNIHVYGHSLPGFTLQTSPETDPRFPYSLDDEIHLIQRNLLNTIEQIDSPQRKQPLQVILIGHSVGAYILLEILRHWHNHDFANSNRISFIAAVCLFPTVVDIAQSPRGRWLAPILCSPGFTWYSPIFAQLLVALIPTFVLIYIVETVLSMPTHAAQTTAAYLKSRWGVRQTIHMAKFEMLQITQDRWPDAMWTRQPDAAAGETPVKYSDLLFYWGKQDYWINDSVREVLIEKRAGSATKQSGQPVMEIDTNGVSHAFSLKHSRLIADRVSRFILERLSTQKP